MAHTPIPIPRGKSGSEKAPDYVSGAPSGITRGKYPKDAGGPPDAGPSSGGKSGDFLTPDPLVTKTIVRPQPKPSPVADTSNPLK